MHRRPAVLRLPAPFVTAAALMLAVFAGPLAGCGGGGADDVAADVAGSLIGAPLPVAGGLTGEALDLVGDVLGSIVDLPTRAPEDGVAAQTYVTLENGCEATVRRGEGGTLEGRISGPQAGLPATYRIADGDMAEVRFANGESRLIPVH